MENKNLVFSILVLMLTAIMGCDSSLDGVDNTEGSTIESAKVNTRSIDLGQSDYYWYQGKKIFLKQKTNKQFVLFQSEKEPIVAKSIKAAKTISHISKEVKLNYVKAINNSTKTKKFKWCILQDDGATVKNLTRNLDIEYSAPFYETADDGKEFGISHLFYVKLKTKEDVDLLISMASKLKVEILGNNEYMPLWYTLSCNRNSTGNSLQAANAFYESGLFENAEPDFLSNIELASSFPNDSYFSKQWNLNGTNSINWKQAYSLSTGTNVKVAIIDQGADYTHPDFNQNIMPIYDLREKIQYATNLYGNHGTRCAGIICAQVNNGKGIAGISPNSTIYVYSHPFDDNVNTDQELATGIAMASQSCDVISCSWGNSTVPSNLITDAIHYDALLWGRNGKGVVVVFATGNNGGSINYPANCNENILAVGAIEKNGRRANFSNYGSKLDVVAPGKEITTTEVSGSYISTFQGTSAACPHVAGVAALILSVNPNLTSDGVIDIIERTARKVGGYSYTTVSGRPNGTWNAEMGYGLVDAYAAVQEAKRMK